MYAILIALHYIAFALGTSRIQIASAVRAEIKSRPHRRRALRTRIRQRLTHQEINNESKNKISRQHHQHQKSPQCRIHPAAPGITIHIAGQKYRSTDPARRIGDSHHHSVYEPPTPKDSWSFAPLLGQGLGFTLRKKWTPRKEFRKVAAWSELGDVNFPGKF